MGVGDLDSGACSNRPVTEGNKGLPTKVGVIFVFPSTDGEDGVLIGGPAKYFKCSFEISFDDGRKLCLPDVVS